MAETPLQARTDKVHLNWRETLRFKLDERHEESLSGLEFLGSGIARRLIRVAILPAPEPSYTDGHTIFLNPSLSLQQRPLVVIAHSALIAAGSLDSQSVKAISLRPAVAARYMAMELPRALELCHCALPQGLLRELPLPANQSEDARTSLAIARDLRKKVAACEPWLGLLRPRRMLKNSDIVQTGGAAGQLKSFRVKQLQEHDEDEDLDRSGASVMKLFSSPLAKASWLSDLLQQILGMGKGGASEQDDDGSGGGAHSGGSANQVSDADVGITDNSLCVAGIDARLPLLPQQVEWLYPEWHDGKGAYLQDWAHVNELETTPDTSSSLEACELSTHTLARQLFKVGVEFENHRRQPTGNDIDIDALVEHMVDRSAGHTHEENIYSNSQRTRRDLSAMMLVDISRSTADKVGNGKTIFGQQIHAARLISRTLSYFGDRVAVYAFHSWGRSLTRLLRIKAFDEPEGALIEERFAGLTPSGLTRLGVAIRHASFRLQQEKYHTHRLLMVFTDGFAYDDEYEGRHAEVDVSKALAEAREQGVACVCISIGSERDDETLERVFGSATYLHCRHVGDLPGRLRRLINTALRSTEKSSRAA